MNSSQVPGQRMEVGNSVDKQLRQKIRFALETDSKADTDQVIGYDRPRELDNSKTFLNERRLTTVIVKGEHVPTKDYVTGNPYAKYSGIQVTNPDELWEGNKRKFASNLRGRNRAGNFQSELNGSLDFGYPGSIISTHSRKSPSVPSSQVGSRPVVKPGLSVGKRNSLNPITSGSLQKRTFAARHQSLAISNQDSISSLPRTKKVKQSVDGRVAKLKLQKERSERTKIV